MLHVIPNLWSKLTNNGIVEGLSDSELRKIRILNQAAGCFVTALLLILTQLGEDRSFSSIIVLGFCTVGITSLILNYYKEYEYARLAFNILGAAGVAFTKVAYGFAFNDEYIFLMFIVTVTFFHDDFRTQMILLIILAVFYVSSLYYVLEFGALRAGVQAVPSVVAILFLASGLIITVVIRLFQSLYRKAERKTKELLASLQQKNTELEIAYQELEKFTYVASHDLKTPLRNVVSFLGLLEKDLQKNDALNKRNKEYLNFAKTGARQMYFLITDILEYSKINNDTNLQFEELDVSEIIMKVMNQIRAYLQERGAEVFAEPIPNIVGNSFLLSLVFQNLIENGVKYNDNKEPKVEISYQKSDTHHFINFKDNGMGIPEAFQQQVFEMFKRLHTNDEIEGTGLGLAICKKIAQTHGGDIEIVSEEGKGSTFTLSVSLALGQGIQDEFDENLMLKAVRQS